MNYYHINEQCLEEDEVNYELRIRGFAIEGPLETRRRALRRMLRESETTQVKNTWYSIEDEYVGIPVKLQQIELAIRNRVGQGCLSRLVHLHKRVRRYQVNSVEQQEKKRMLLSAVTQMALQYFGVNLDILAQAVPVMTLVTGPEEANAPSVPDGPVAMTRAEGGVGANTAHQSLRDDLIVFSPYPNDGAGMESRRHTFPVTINQAARLDMLQPIVAPQPQRASAPEDGEPNGDPGTPQFRKTVQVQLNRRPSTQGPASVPMSGVAFQVNPFDRPAGVERGQEPVNHHQDELLGKGHPKRNFSPDLEDGTSYYGSLDTSSLNRQVRAENKVASNEFVRVSEMEAYIKNCIGQMTREIVDNLTDRFTHVGLMEPKQAEGLRTEPIGRTFPAAPVLTGQGFQSENRGKEVNFPSGMFSQLPNSSMSFKQPQLQPTASPEPFPNPYRRSDISPDQPRLQPLTQSGLLGPFGTGNSMGSQLNQTSYMRQRLPHQTCNIIEKWPKFSGEGNAVPVVDFLRQIEILSRSYQVSQEELRVHAHMLFKGDAYVWFTAYDDKMDSWDRLVTMLKMRYDNPNRDKSIREDMRNRKQKPSEPFSAYLTDIEAMSQRLIRKMSDAEKFDLVMDNMKLSYRRRLALQPIQSLDHLAQLCYQFDSLESNMYLTRTVTKPVVLNQIFAEDELEDLEEVAEEDDPTVMALRPKMSRKDSNKFSGPNMASEQQSTDQPLCWNCRSLGHMWRECTQRKTLFCHICGHTNTTAYQCPQKHNLKPRETSDSKNE